MTRVSSRDELSALLGALIEEKGIRNIVRWDTPALSILDHALTGAGAKVIPINLNEDETSRAELRNSLINADMGLTEVDYAIADIGSLVLRASGPQSRLASVLPPIHVAVVASDRIVASLAHLLPLLNSPEISSRQPCPWSRALPAPPTSRPSAPSGSTALSNSTSSSWTRRNRHCIFKVRFYLTSAG